MTDQVTAANDVLEKTEINFYSPAMLINCSYRFRLYIEKVRSYQQYLPLPRTASASRAAALRFGIAFDSNDTYIFEFYVCRFTAEFNGLVKNNSLFDSLAG